MVLVRLTGLNRYKDKNGKERCYFRRTGQAIDLVRFPFGSPEFVAEYSRLVALSRKGAETKPGTLGLLIKAYTSHDAYNGLKRRTRADYDRCFQYLSAIADTPLAKFTPPLVVKIRDAAGQAMGRKWGNYVKACLSLVFAWGMERGYLAANPARGIKGIKKPKDAPEANRPWADHERDAVMAHGVLRPAMRLPMALMMYCGLDPSDCYRLPKTAIRDGAINTRRGKTGQAVWIPLPAPVIAELDDAPAHDAITVCAKADGTPWSKSGFDGAWQKARAPLLEAGKIEPGVTLKGLRHTVATILAEMGYDARAIADMLGQKTTAMGEHYSRRANRADKLGKMVVNFDAEIRRRGKKGA